MTAAMTDALTVALSFARRGWRPIPLDHPSLRRCTGPTNDAHDPRTCDKRGKHPAGKWGTIAAHDPSEKWLASVSMFGGEARNVGIAVKLSGLIVLDEDELDALARMAAELGEAVPATYRVRTAKGWHYYFTAPDGAEIGNRTKGTPLAEYCIDVRGGKGDGGYVVGAGSLHASGHVYAAEDDDAAAAPLPVWLVDLLTEQAEEAVGEGVRRDPDEVRTDTLERFVDDYRRSVTACTHRGGVWREELFKAALDGWRLIDLDELSVEQLVDDLNERCRTVWGADLDARDDRIVHVEARTRALRSPWEVADFSGYKVEKPPRDRSASVNDPCGTRAESSTIREPSQADAPSADRYADLDMALDVYLDGDVDPLPTDRGMTRSDGLPLLYAGLTHMAVGETEAGKSWLALACAMAEMSAGRRVLYVHFEESDPRGTVLRLRQMGAPREWFTRGLFRFAGIEMPLAVDRVAHLVEHAPDLAVLDGVNAAMALHGMNPDKADEYGAWDQRLARPLAATGAAVLSLDHVVKNPEAASRGYAGGTVMKLNLISGASFLLENREPLRPGAKGATSIYVAKDRPGSLREVGELRSGRRALLGTFWVDSTSPLTLTSWTVPQPSGEPIERDRRGAVDGEAIRVLRVLVEMVEEEGRDPDRAPSAREIRVRPGGLGFRKDATTINGHLDTLEAHGLIANTVTKGAARWEPTAKGRKAALPDGVKDPDDL
jgi:hypothetical protein